MLQDCFDHADWDMFRVASDNNIDVYTDTVAEFKRKCIGDVVPTVTIKTYSNQKPWIDGSICAKLEARSTAFNHGKVTGNMVEYKQCSYSLRKAIKQAKRQYRDKVESQFNGSDTRRIWQGPQTITDYKGNTSHVADTDVLLPDKLNTFFARFEDNTVPSTQSASKNSGLPFAVADVSKTFKRANPRKALAADSEHVQTSLLEWLQTYSISPYHSLLSPLASRCPPLFLYTRKRRYQKGVGINQRGAVSGAEVPVLHPRCRPELRLCQQQCRPAS
ncbi:uncharacterized protein isoform X1 [Salmo salar]|uniref:Uncharacterized protein isoform X1 n=1 Tax=Salmo salar TaxID=8030 RepID=A0ABM3EI30_SALSA|nr:uncharacterized protein LOC106600457 isoform X1 [Salmo salar]